MNLPTVFSSTDLELLHQQLEALRQAQSGRRRLPAALWVAAADLARIHSPSHVARNLRLSYPKLRQQMDQSRPKFPAAPDPVRFVECQWPPLQADPMDGALFVFCSRNRRALKCLVYDSQGFWLCQKRLSSGRFAAWPRTAGSARVALSAHQLLTLPWVRVPHLASHVMARVARRIPADWQALYRHPVHLLESFVDTERFAGTCYRAANWLCVGRSLGLGTKSKPGARTSIKDLWVRPLRKDFRAKLLAP